MHQAPGAGQRASTDATIVPMGTEQPRTFWHKDHGHVLLDDVATAGGDGERVERARCAECGSSHQFSGLVGQRFCSHCGLIEASQAPQR